MLTTKKVLNNQVTHTISTISTSPTELEVIEKTEQEYCFMIISWWIFIGTAT